MVVGLVPVFPYTPELKVENRKALTFLEVGHQLVDDVLHGAVEADVLQRVRLVDHDVARRACVVLLQMLDQAALADCEQEREHFIRE